MRTVQGPLARAMAAHAKALAAGDGAALTNASDEFSRLGAAFYAAEASAQASRIHLSAGEHTRAAAAAARAIALAEPGGGLHTPVVRALGPHPLTEREREIAALAADGLTSKQIAGRLFVSRRTVDNHLGSMYATLGVHTRGELERFVPRPPAPPPES